MGRRPFHDPLSGPPDTDATAAGRGRAWVAVVGVVLAVVVAAGGFALLGPSDDDVAGGSDTPGFAATGRDVGQDSFELAQPTTTAGPTTIPGLAKNDEDDQVFDFDTTTSTSTTTTSTTTTLPTRVIVPSADDIASICGMIDSVQSLQVLFADPTVDAEPAMTAVLRNLDRYAQLSPPEMHADVTALRGDLAALISILRSVEWDTRSPAARDAVRKIQEQQPPFEHLTDRAGRILFYESATCAA